MDKLFNIFASLKWDENGSAKASPEAICLYTQDPKLFNDNGFIMDDTGIIKRSQKGHYKMTTEVHGKEAYDIHHMSDNVDVAVKVKAFPKLDEPPLPVQSNRTWTGKMDVNELKNAKEESSSAGLAKLANFIEDSGSDKNPEDDKQKKKIIKKTKIKYEKELYDYQINHVKLLVSALRKAQCALDASETGTGKTHSALVVAKNLKKNVMVCCPKPIIYAWYDAFQLHGFKIATTQEEAKKLSKKGKRWGFVTNYEQFKNGNAPFVKMKYEKKTRETVYSWKKFPEDAILIVDEIQRAKNYKTQNSKMLYSAYDSGVSMLLLSATAVDKVMFMYTIGHLLDLYRSVVHFKQWARTKKILAPDDAIPEKYCLKQLHDHIFPNRGSRMTIASAGDMFPDNNVIWEPFVNNKIKKIMALMVKHVKKIMAAKEPSNCILTEIIRAKQECELLKVPVFIEMAENLIAEGKSVAIFLNYCESIEKVAMALGTDCIIWGDNKDANERENIRRRFVENKSKIIICNIASGGVGISLHDTSPDGSHPRVSLINPTWSAQDLKQTLGRIYRSGCKSKCIQKIIYSPQTVEEKIMDVVKFKLESIDIVNDGPIDLLKKVI